MKKNLPKAISKRKERQAMLTLIEYFNNAKPGHFILDDYLVYKNVCEKSETKHLLEYLVAKGLVTYDYDSIAEDKTIRLGKNAYTYLEDSKQQRNATLKSWLRAAVEDTKFVVSTAIAFLEFIYIIVTAGK